MNATWIRLCLALVLLGGLAACSNTLSRAREDTATDMEKTGQAIEKASEKIEPQ